ncbi:unnamed protein product [Linum trigynum]|uniref:Uncharacterized protein n=1 Tax=Linum trigynum TaxID=586398 RepID=A0AAV2F4Y2_9ROSI
MDEILRALSKLARDAEVRQGKPPISETTMGLEREVGEEPTAAAASLAAVAGAAKVAASAVTAAEAGRSASSTIRLGQATWRAGQVHFGTNGDTGLLPYRWPKRRRYDVALPKCWAMIMWAHGTMKKRGVWPGYPMGWVVGPRTNPRRG